jgi:F-type H+-transporting ATPase subunit epsilon
MDLEIVSPEKIIYSGKADAVTVPGLKGSFTILKRHAPIISGLKKGRVRYLVDGKNETVKINEGFVEAENNNVTVCIE